MRPVSVLRSTRGLAIVRQITYGPYFSGPFALDQTRNRPRQLVPERWAAEVVSTGVLHERWYEDATHVPAMSSRRHLSLDEEAERLRCRILNVGPTSGIHNSLRIQLEAQRLASVQHVETESLALMLLRKVAEHELPHIVLVPFQLPVSRNLEFIAAVQSLQRENPIRVFVWGSEIPSHQINWIYGAGAACVMPGQFNIQHLDAMHAFCATCTEVDRRTKTPRRAMPLSLIEDIEKDLRNAKLGKLFLQTGCLSAVLWIVSILQAGGQSTRPDLMPLPVYAALAGAGLSLMVGTRPARIAS